MTARASIGSLLPGSRLELVQVPAQPVLDPGPLGNEIVAVVDQQPDLPLGAVEPRGRQVLPESCPGNRKGVDRIALAGLARRAPGAGHELGWHAHHGLTGPDQIRR